MGVTHIDQAKYVAWLAREVVVYAPDASDVLAEPLVLIYLTFLLFF